MTISESNSSPASTASHTPPESPTNCSTETHQSTSKEASEDSGNSVKDTSESLNLSSTLNAQVSAIAFERPQSEGSSFALERPRIKKEIRAVFQTQRQEKTHLNETAQLSVLQFYFNI